ncbi:hypothetical protein HR060_02955 [Catenovulum sp. SM1970]|uniref:hypothetical protein n=1 Tax=Marinifaba aquimaris TaxID=2741323 RepID=UPI001572A6DB|nr:hypothetical protein [Marinifaba aquimaris]NTS75815.1 hypothetical protein [Marinifaba aquimaris]
MIKLKPTTLVGIGLVASFITVLFYHASYYYPFISDDTLISLRYSARLLAGEGLTWTEGIPVEGYSNLLWVLLIALLGWFGMDLVDASRVLSFAGMSTIMIAIAYWYSQKDNFKTNTFAIFISLAFLALSGPIAVWAIGGLEQPLYAACIAAALPFAYHIVESNKVEKNSIIGLSIALGLACITRPDGPLFTVACAAAFFIYGLWSKRQHIFLTSFLILPITIGFFLAQLAFRLYYYGEWVPNTALVKIAPSSHHFLNGFNYFKDGFLSLAPFSILAVVAMVGLLFSPKSRPKALILLLMFVLWSSYMVFIGGDIFPAYRHHVPLMVVFAFAIAEGAKFISLQLAEDKAKWHFASILIGCSLLAPLSYLQFNEERNHKAVTERWEWDGKRIAETLKAAFDKEQPLMAVTAAGCLPYWSELPSLDMLGLNDYYLPRNPPADFGKGFLGHELGEGKYVIEQNPDLIIFHMGMRPIFRSGRELNDMPEFHDNYIPQQVRISGNRQPSTIYFNKKGNNIGIQQADDKIIIPGYLFKNDKSNHLYLNEDNKLVNTLKARQSMVIHLDNAEQTKWDVSIKSPDSYSLMAQQSQSGEKLTLVLVSKSNRAVDVEQVVLTAKTGTMSRQAK